MGTQTIIISSVKKAHTYLESAIGLIGKKTPYSLFLQTRFGIHTFGLRFPIDVIILDKNHQVVALKENLLSNRLFFWNPRYDHVLEMPAGIIKQSKIRKGSVVRLRLQD